MNRLKDMLEEIERNVGAIAMFLYAGEYSQKDLKGQLESLREEIDKLRLEVAEVDEAYDRAPASSPAKHELYELLTRTEQALERLGEAEDTLLDLCQNPTSRRLPQVTVGELDSACDALTKAMEACK